MNKLNVTRSVATRVGTIAGGAIVALSLWLGLGGSMQAAPPDPDPVTCVPTCELDGRSLVSAGDDNTTLSSQEIVLGLSFTVGAGPDGNFELFDGDNNAANWDVLFNCGNGCPGTGAAAPQLIVELFADPNGIGGQGAPLIVWSPDTTPFPTTNNGWAGVTFPHDPSAGNDPLTTYFYALHVRPFTPETDKGWNAFKVRAAGTVILLGNQVVGFLAAMNNPGDLTTIYPHWNELPVGSNLTDSPYDGTWVFKTKLPSFLGDVTVFDGDMDFGNAACTYNDTDDPDSSNAAVPPFALGSAAVPEGIAVANAPNACPDPPGGTRTGTPAEDASSAAFRRVPSIIPAGIAYQLKAPGSQQNPNGQVFLNQNPSGNKEWEQFKIQLVDDASDIPNGACPVGGYPEDIGKGYAASDCRTTDLPGGVWEIQLDGMDLSNLNFWFFSFKVEPIETQYSIGRLVWYDANENQQQDMCGPDPCAEEHGIGGVAYTVYHFDTPGIPDGTVARTGFTNADPGHPSLRVGEFLEEGLPAGNYTVEVDASNFAAAAPLNGLTSTTGGEIETGVEVGLPVCIDTNNPAGCGQPGYAEAIFGYVAPSGDGVMAPTNTTCAQYAAGNIPEENVAFYALDTNNKIKNTAPGVIFFYTKVTVGAGQTLSVAQSHTGSAPLIALHDNQGKAYTLGCAAVLSSATYDSQTGVVTFAALPAGTYIVQLKMSPKSTIGANAPNPSTSNYTWVAQLNGVPQPGTQNDTPLAFTKK